MLSQPARYASPSIPAGSGTYLGHMLGGPGDRDSDAVPALLGAPRVWMLGTTRVGAALGPFPQGHRVPSQGNSHLHSRADAHGYTDGTPTGRTRDIRFLKMTGGTSSGCLPNRRRLGELLHGPERLPHFFSPKAPQLQLRKPRLSAVSRVKAP